MNKETQYAKISQKQSNSLLLLLLLLYSMIVLTPSLSVKVPFLISGALIAFMLLLFIFKTSTSDFMKFLFLTMGWFLYTVLLKLIGHSTATWGNFLNQLGFYFIMIASFFIIEKMPEEEKKRLVWGIIAIIVFNLVDNIRLNFLYDSASINAIKTEWYTELEGLNIGTTRFNTMLLFFFASVFFVFLNATDGKRKCFFFLISSATVFYLVFQGMRASIVFLLVLLLTLMIYTEFSTKSKNASSGFVLLFIIFFLVFIFYVPVLEFIRDLIDVDRVSIRINDLIYSLQNGISEDSFSGRNGLISISMDSFLRSPFWGIGDHRTADFTSSNISKVGIGGHSELIDSLARYGIFGFVFLYMIFSKLFKKMREEKINKIHHAQTFVCVLIFLISGAIKTVLYPEIAIAVFLLFPNIKYIIKKDRI